MKKLGITVGSLLLLVALVFFAYKSVAVLDQEQPVSPLRAQSKEPRKLQNINLPKISFNMPQIDLLDELTAKIVGLTGASIEERNDQVWDLKKKNLRKVDFEALFSFLKQNPRDGSTQQAWHSLKNDLLTFVIVDGRYKETTGQLMIDIINDQEQHEVMREYVIQYIPDYFERHWLDVKGKDRSQKNGLSEEESALQQAFVNTMWNMLEDRRGPIPGTSLIRLHELSETFSIINKEEVDKATEQIIMDQSMPVSSRMAALSVASERGLHQTLKLAEEIIFDPASSVSLRMAALNSACSLNPDEELLERIQQKFIDNNLEDKRLIRAAYLTLKKLKKDRG